MKKLLGLALGVLSLIAGLVLFNVFGTNAEAYGDARDCNNDAVVRCGVHSQTGSEGMIARYKGDVGAAWAHYGIAKSDVEGKTSEIKKGYVYKNGNVVVDGKIVATGAISFGREKANGKSFVAGGTRFYEESAQTGFVAQSIAAFIFMKDGKFHAAILTSCGNPVRATPKPAPIYRCAGLTAAPLSRNSYRFTAKAVVRDATIKQYRFFFGDGATKTVVTSAATATADRTYEKPSDYTAKVIVDFMVNGKLVSVTHDGCTAKLKVVAPQEAACTKLTGKELARTEYEFTATAAVSGGATIIKYVYTFGDGKTQEVPSTAATNTIKHTYATQGTYNVSVVAHAKIDGTVKPLTGAACNTKVTVKEEPKTPVYTCDQLTKTPLTRTSYKFDAKATAKDGATIANYVFNFGDGKTETVNATASTATINHEYAKAGTYTAMVTVNVKVDGQTKPVTGENCKVTVTIAEEPQTPVYKCDALTARLIKLEDRSYAYTVDYTEAGGAKLTKIALDFGDGETRNYLPAERSAISHAYAKEGTYKTTATLTFEVPAAGTVTTKDVQCETVITVSPEMCPTNPSLPKNHPDCGPCEVPGKQHLPKNHPDCKTVEYCEVPGKTHLPKNSPECKEDEVVPPVELPKTGPGEMILGVIGLGSIAAAGYYWINSRRNLIDAFNR